MARRGKELREHVLFTAKDVFLELGFERASMDAVAARAQTSKRSLYAHFENKEQLFLAVIDFVRGLVLDRLGVPSDYADDPGEALVRFCGRYLEILLYRGSIQLSRVVMAEAARFPEGAARYHDLIFTQVVARLAAHFRTAFRLEDDEARQRAEHLLGLVLYPRYPRALFGVDSLAASFGAETLSPDFDLVPVRSAVAQTLALIGEAEASRNRLSV